MKRWSWFRPLMACAAFAAAAGAFGCSKKSMVDPGFTQPEGVFSPNAQLAVYPDLGNKVLVKHFSLTTNDYVLDSTFTVTNVGLGVLQGMVFDGTAANGYQILRRQSGGGYSVLKDFALMPATRWLSSGWEVYMFHDPTGSGYSPPSYLGRGLFGGQVATTSPLTNPGILGAAPLADLHLTGAQAAPFGLSEFDSVFTISWNPVAGATRYWVQIFNYRSDLQNNTEKYLIGVPAPISTGKVHEFVVAYVQAPGSSFTVGSSGPNVLKYEPMLKGQVVHTRVSALDADGRMLACTTGVPDTARTGTHAFIFSLAAEKTNMIVPGSQPPAAPH